MKTKEERERARLQRALEKEQAKKQFPAARLGTYASDWGVSVELEEGDSEWMNIHARGEWRKHRESWAEGSIFLDDPVLLAIFIRALTARYNHIVARMNEHVAVMDIAETIK